MSLRKNNLFSKIFRPKRTAFCNAVLLMYVHLFCIKTINAISYMIKNAGAKYSGVSLIFLFRRLRREFLSEHIPQCTRNTYGRISTAYDTHHQRQREIADAGHTQHIQAGNHDKRSQGSENTSGQRLRDALVHYILQIILSGHHRHILTHTVKDNDGRVDGVTNNGQHTCDKGIAHGNLCRRIEGQHHQHIMHQRCNTADAETQILEPDPDIDQHADNGNHHRNDRIGLHLVTDRGTDGLGGDHILRHTEILDQRRIQRLSLLYIQTVGLKDDLIGLLHILYLYGTAGHLLDHRHHSCSGFLQGHALVKCHRRCGTALKLQTVIQHITGLGLIDTHDHESGYDHSQRNSEEKILLS